MKPSAEVKAGAKASLKWKYCVYYRMVGRCYCQMSRNCGFSVERDAAICGVKVVCYLTI